MSIASYQRDPTGVGQRLRAAREASGEGLDKVAVSLGISGFQLGKIERGHVKRATHKVGQAIEQLLHRYGVDTDASIERESRSETAAPPLPSPYAEHLARQREYLTEIPALRAEVEQLTKELSELRALLTETQTDGISPAAKLFLKNARERFGSKPADAFEEFLRSRRRPPDRPAGKSRASSR